MRIVATDGAHGFDAAHDGHAEIDQGNVGHQTGKHVDELLAVGSFTDYLHTGFGLDDGSEAFADDRVVVGYGNSDLIGSGHRD